MILNKMKTILDKESIISYFHPADSLLQNM